MKVSRRAFLAPGTTAAALAAAPRAFPDESKLYVVEAGLPQRVIQGQEGLGGVSIFNPDGKLIGRVDLPERCANLCFGGTQRNRLFMAASTSIYSLYVNTQGAPGG